MTRSNFFRGLAFALAAGAAAPFGLFLAGGQRGIGNSMLFAVVLYLLFAHDNLRRGLGAGALALVLGVPFALFLRDPNVLTLLSLVTLALCRSAVLYPRPFARALAWELVFMGTGALGAFVWWDWSAVGVCLSTWSFWLIQSAFALTVTSSAGRDEAPSDPFERAHAAAEAVLAGRPR